MMTALLDTFLCFQDNLDNVENYLLEAHRVLKDDGHLLVISHGLPDTRLEYFPADMWAVEVVEMGECMQFVMEQTTTLYSALMCYSCSFLCTAKPAIDSNFLKNELSPNHFLFVCTKVQSNA